MGDRDAALARLREVMLHVRTAAVMASTVGEVKLGILSVKPDGAGRVLATFDATFLDDVEALLTDAPEARDADRSCEHFVPGTPSGTCQGDGHYMCRECEEKERSDVEP